MAEFQKEQVTGAFLSKLYESLTAQPDIKADALPADRFIAWCQPGLPFEPEDFMFAVKGIGTASIPEVSATDNDEESTSEASPGSPTAPGSEAEDVRQRILRAADWSRLTNFIPNASGIYDENRQKKMFESTAFNQDGSSIASIYHNVLRFSEVASAELRPELRERIEHFRNLLTTVKEEEDLFTGEKTETLVDSPLVVAYNTYMSEYLDAALEYNSKRLNALNSEDALAVQDWALNAHNYRRRVQSAHDKWVSVGHKNDVEKISAFINQVTMRDLSLLKRDLLDKIDKSIINDPTSGESFYWTSMIPATLPFSNGWTEQSFSYSETDVYRNSKSNAWSSGGFGSVGFFSIAARGSGSRQSYEGKVDMTNFSVKFEIAQAMIARPWCATEFLFSNAWRFSPDMPNLTNMTQSLSDGKQPPAGSMVAYPTTAIFVRNVTVDFKELHNENSSLRKEIEGRGGVSIGPVHLGGSYKRGERESKFHSEITKEGLKIPGMQLIGFKCKLLPELPNPSPNVEKWA